MLDSLFIHKVRAIRFAEESRNEIGEPINSSSPIGSSPNYIPARIESYDSKLEYNPSDQRKQNKTIVYIPPATILQVNDLLFDFTTGVGVEIGKIQGINPGLKGKTTDIDHYEIIIEKP